MVQQEIYGLTLEINTKILLLKSSIFDSIYDTTISIENEVENYLTFGNNIKSNIQNCH